MKELDVRDLWESALIDMVFDFPVYAELVTKIGCKLVDSHKPNLAWTDGTAIYLNKRLIKLFNEKPEIKLEDGRTINRYIGKKEMIFLLCHEVMHLVALTWDRMQNVNIYEGVEHLEEKLKLWNQATDYEINSLLHNNESKADNGYPKRNPIGNMPEFVLYESCYKDNVAEQIYQELYEENKDNFGKGNGGGGSSATWYVPEDESEEAFGFDEHLPLADDATKSEIKQKIIEVFGSKTNGTGSSALDRVMKEALKPQPFNWRRALTKYIRGWMKDNYTWNKPSRAGIASNLILPSAGRVPKMHIGVAVDTSGSIYDTELHAMMNHLFTILTQFKDFVVDVWCCGSEVYPETFRRYTSQNKKELANFEFKSDGGNDMRMNFEFIREKYRGDKLDVFICMSDFYDPLDGDTETTSPCPCIFMCLDHPDFTPPSKIKSVTYPFVVEKEKNGY